MQAHNAINNSENKVTTKTPFELLHGYRSKFQLDKPRPLSKKSEGWKPPEELQKIAQKQLELSKVKRKKVFDIHRHYSTRYIIGEIVVMKGVPVSTEESKKLQRRY